MLHWKANNTPISAEFDDIYYAEEDGCAESRYVFYASCDVAEKLKRKVPVRVAELGFGTGLNLFVSLRENDLQQLSEVPFHFISCENSPLEVKDIERALSRWPELKTNLEIFLSFYEPGKLGWQHIRFSSSSELSLYIGDVRDFLNEIKSPVDAWFLDGFAPKKNPHMWSKEVFESMGRLSVVGTTFSTFAAAGFVRRGLEASGFEVLKEQGFGRKREMLRGSYRE